jgi:hypothetical protein
MDEAITIRRYDGSGKERKGSDNKSVLAYAELFYAD